MSRSDGANKCLVEYIYNMDKVFLQKKEKTWIKFLDVTKKKLFFCHCYLESF